MWLTLSRSGGLRKHLQWQDRDQRLWECTDANVYRTVWQRQLSACLGIIRLQLETIYLSHPALI
jgi:hypothetical protein